MSILPVIRFILFLVFFTFPAVLTMAFFGRNSLYDERKHVFWLLIVGPARIVVLACAIAIYTFMICYLIIKPFNIQIDSQLLTTYITAGAGFCVYFYNSLYNILFNKDSELPNKMHILLCEIDAYKIEKANEKQIVKWLETVYLELKRFGLHYSQVCQHLELLLYRDESHQFISIIKTLLRIKKKNVKFETNDIEEIITALLILAGDKKVDDFVPVSATIEATKASGKKKILHVTKKRPCDASENTRCSDND